MLLKAFLVTLLSVSGAQPWRVTYTAKSICALKGSSVEMHCSYSYPSTYKVQEKFWFIDRDDTPEPEDLSHDWDYSARVKYVPSWYNEHRLKITQLKMSDSKTYRFRFLTDRKEKYTGQPGITLEVTDLQAMVTPSTVSVGQGVRLTCTTTCSLPGSPAFIWYKNEYALRFTKQEHWFIARSNDGGKYSCAVKGQNDLRSPAVTLSVRCLEVEIKSDSVTVGDLVTLTCKVSVSCTPSSISGPYIWYKDGQNVQSTYFNVYDFSAGREHAGSYSCGVQSNEYSSSKAASLTVKYRPRIISVSVNPPGDIMEGSSVTLTCSNDANPPAWRYIWFRNNRIISDTSGSEQHYTIKHITHQDGGQYHCQAENEIGENSSSSELVNVLYSPKNITLSVNPSSEIMEGSTVTLTCRSDASPPVQRYTWFKNNRYVSSESRGPLEIYSIKHITIWDTGEYYCVAENSVGANTSPLKRLDVQYSPRNTKVSVSPSSEIVEGRTVTFTCSSDANPSAQRCTWFMNNRTIFSERVSECSYIIANISSEDSGEYYCESQNPHGAQNSTAVIIDVQFAPRNTAVSVSAQGEIALGSSVTLTCRSEANAPQQRYTWFKKNETGVLQTGSGKNFEVSNFKSWDNGQYWCESWNTLGAQNSTAELVTAQGGHSMIAAVAGGAAAIVAFVFLGAVWVSRRRKSTNEAMHAQEGMERCESHVYSNVLRKPMTHNEIHGTGRDNGEVPLYSSMQPINNHKQEEVLYATVSKSLPQCENDVEYASIQFQPPSTGPRSKVQGKEDLLVIYSTVSTCND
ncbi:hypothetical protein GJAV_G00004880 [Gymnothorax javanicus]|nr:hypothetical protein GJAV_G00004880 [Gymnothorax javanicus]